MRKPSGLKNIARQSFFDKIAASAIKNGQVTVQLRPKGATADDVIKAMDRKGLIARRNGPAVVVFSKDGLMALVGETIADVTVMGNLLVVQDVPAPLLVTDYRQWANLNGLGSRLSCGTLYIERKAAA